MSKEATAKIGGSDTREEKNDRQEAAVAVVQAQPLANPLKMGAEDIYRMTFSGSEA